MIDIIFLDEITLQLILTDAEPAVTTPSFLKTVGNFANVSRVVFGFGCSSTFTITSDFFTFMVTGANSALNTLLLCARNYYLKY